MVSQRVRQKVQEKEKAPVQKKSPVKQRSRVKTAVKTASPKAIPSNSSLKRLGLRAGISRQSQKNRRLYETERSIFDRFVHKTLRLSMIMSLNDGRKTIDHGDVVSALKLGYGIDTR